MGAKDSKLSFLTYEEAVKRITEDELQRTRETFKRHSGNTNILSKSVFIGDVLGELVPCKLSEQLYGKCGGNSKGIGFREVVVLLVLITKGTLDEKVRFLFYLISVDGSIITQEDLENFYFACDGDTSTVPKCISVAFWRSEKLNYDEFFQWVISNSLFSTATRWLLEEQQSNHGIKISNDCNTESFYHSLANLTKLTEEDIIELEKHYWSLKSVSTTGKFDLQAFKFHVCPPLPEQFSQGLFQFFDKNDDGHIDFKELVCGISLCCRGSNTERLRACFEIFDIDKDNYLSKEDLLNMLTGLYEISQQYGAKIDIDKSCENFIQNFNFKQRENLSLDEFQLWAYSSSLIYEFLLLVSQISHIIFGLCPLFKKEEGNIVRRWIERESIKGLQFGSLYYIISITWWNAWKKCVSFEISGSSQVQLIKKRNSDDSNDSWFDEIIDTTVNNVNKNEICSETTLDAKQNHFAFNDEPSLKSHNIIHMSTRNDLGSSPVSPGIIGNMALLAPNDNRKLMVLTGEGGKLKQDVVLIYGKNYEVVPEPIWKAFAAWYDSDVALPRTVIVEPGNSEPELELYPIQIDLYRHIQPPKGLGFNMGALGINNIMTQLYGNIVGNLHTSNNSEQPALVAPKRTLQYRACFSRKNTVRQIIDFLSQRLKIGVEDLRLWVMDDESEMMLLEEEEKVVGDICSSDGGKLLIEVRNRDLSWPEEMNSLVTTRNFRERSNTGPLEKGATGLHNLGNTCFMNSAVQCLSNTKPLTRYFSEKLFEYELNKSNPLGMKGVLAKRYGDLIIDLWSGIYRSIAPVKLRCTIGRYAPRFNGFQQHDSQEFLSFLLDGLHEDVNRVHEKPYVELKDSNGRPDSIVAQEAWENHGKRNQSIIVDLFQGQLKSQVRCLHCSHCSVTFDPFTFLSLPLPMERSIHLEIPVFLKNGEQAKRYGVLLSQVTTIKMLKSKLSSLCCVPAEKLLLAEVGGPTIIKFLPDKVKVHQNLAGYIYVYELEHDVSDFLNSRHSTQYDNTKSNSDSKDLINKSITSSVNKSPCTTVHTNIGSCTNTMDKQTNSSLYKDNNKDNSTLGKKSKTSLKTKSRFSNNVNPVKILEVTPKDFVTEKTNINMSTKDYDSLEVAELTDIDSINPLSQSSSDCPFQSFQHGFITAMHRKMIQSNNYFLSWQKFRPSLFGIPIILSYHKEMTNKDVYDKIWVYVSKYVTGVTLSDETERRYPFDIKCVDKDGNYCMSCPWYKFCRGCIIAYNNSTFNLPCSHVAVDWDSTTLHLHYQQSQEKNFCDDVSIEESQRLIREPISLDQCLKDFTKEEELGEDETWYCSKCKQHRLIAKKLDIWKLPPVFVIHLKRFQAVNNRWIKSNKLVRFPTKLFDPSMYVAKNNLKKTNSGSLLTSNNGDNPSTNIMSVDILSNLSETCIPIEDPNINSTSVSCSTITIENISCAEVHRNSDVIINEDGTNDCVYSLYAISCHSGMLNGGHYITYAKNPNGKWYCYNDSSCKEVDISLIEKESPYMLFFEKKSLNSMNYMPNIDDKEAVNIQLEEEEFEKEVKKYCSVM